MSTTVTSWAIERAFSWKMTGKDLVIACVAGRVGGAGGRSHAVGSEHRALPICCEDRFPRSFALIRDRRAGSPYARECA